MKAVVDSGPLIHLAAVNQFALLRLYFSELLVSQAVSQEVVGDGRDQPGRKETEDAQRSGWITLVPVEDPARITPFLRRGMSPADASVIALAQRHLDHILLTDDLTVRNTALGIGLQVYGTIGMLIDGKRDGHIPLLKQILNQLIDSGFFLDPHGILYQQALRLAGEA